MKLVIIKVDLSAIVARQYLQRPNKAGKQLAIYAPHEFMPLDTSEAVIFIHSQTHNDSLFGHMMLQHHLMLNILKHWLFTHTFTLRAEKISYHCHYYLTSVATS